MRARVAQALRHRVTAAGGRLREVAARLRPARLTEMVRLREQYLDDLVGRWARAVRRLAERARDGLHHASVRLEGLSPLAVLRRGYSVTREHPSGRVLRAAEGVAPGTTVESLLGRGLLRSRVEEVEECHPFEALGADVDAEGRDGEEKRQEEL